jgi:hypothetical protein
VRESPSLARIALALNIAGTILLALSFQATSSDFRFITAQGYDHYGKLSPGNTAYAVCIQDYAVILTDTVTGTLLGSARRCPDWQQALPSAVVTAEHPSFLWKGLGLSAIGFFIQLLMVPNRKTLPETLPETVPEVNKRIRILREQKREIELSQRRPPP